MKNEGMRALANCTQLTSLNVAMCFGVTDEGTVRLLCSNAVSTASTRAGMCPLAAAGRLQELTLSNTMVWFAVRRARVAPPTSDTARVGAGYERGGARAGAALRGAARARPLRLPRW